LLRALAVIENTRIFAGKSACVSWACCSAEIRAIAFLARIKALTIAVTALTGIIAIFKHISRVERLLAQDEVFIDLVELCWWS
jgi:hypothetical protein